MDGGAQSNGFRQRFCQWGPSDRDDGLCYTAAHQANSLSKQEDVHLVAGFREGIGVQKGEGCFGGVIGAPRTFDQDSTLGLLLCTDKERLA